MKRERQKNGYSVNLSDPRDVISGHGMEEGVIIQFSSTELVQCYIYVTVYAIGNRAWTRQREYNSLRACFGGMFRHPRLGNRHIDKGER